MTPSLEQLKAEARKKFAGLPYLQLDTEIDEIVEFAAAAVLAEVEKVMPPYRNTEIFHTAHDGDYLNNTWSECREAMLSALTSLKESL